MRTDRLSFHECIKSRTRIFRFLKMIQFLFLLLVPIFETIPTSLDELNDFHFGNDDEGKIFDDSWYVDFYGPIQEMRVYCDAAERKYIAVIKSSIMISHEDLHRVHNRNFCEIRSHPWIE